MPRPSSSLPLRSLGAWLALASLGLAGSVPGQARAELPVAPPPVTTPLPSSPSSAGAGAEAEPGLPAAATPADPASGAARAPDASGELPPSWPLAAAPVAPATDALDLSPPAAQPRSPRFYERWWFWTAVAAVGVTAIVIVATSGPSPPRTDLPNMPAF